MIHFAALIWDDEGFDTTKSYGIGDIPKQNIKHYINFSLDRLHLAKDLKESWGRIGEDLYLILKKKI